MKTKTQVKAGGVDFANHNQRSLRSPGLRVKSGLKAGGIFLNHNARSLRIKTGVKAGGIPDNHNARSLRVKTGVKAGPIIRHDGVGI